MVPDEVASLPEVPGKYMMYFEDSQSDGSRILCRIENFVPWHEGFSRLITERRMQQAVSELFGEESVLFKDKINFKLPGGDAVFFDSYAPHRSQPNHTAKARRVLYITYNKISQGDSRERYYTEKRNNYPPDIERDPGREYSFKV